MPDSATPFSLAADSARSAALSPAALQQALQAADGAASVREAAAALRQHWPGLRVVVVDAMDMRGEPAAASSSRYALHLGATDGHCWQVTTDWQDAAGLFISPRA